MLRTSTEYAVWTHKTHETSAKVKYAEYTLLSAKKISGCWPFFWEPCQRRGWYGSAVGEKEESCGEHISGHVLSLTSAGPSCSLDAVLQQGSGSSEGLVDQGGRFILSFSPHQAGKKPCPATAGTFPSSQCPGCLLLSRQSLPAQTFSVLRCAPGWTQSCALVKSLWIRGYSVLGDTGYSHVDFQLNSVLGPPTSFRNWCHVLETHF